MEQLKEIVSAYGEVVLRYVSIAIAYFLFFLFKNKVSNTSLNLNSVMNEQRTYIAQTDKTLREEFANGLRGALENYNNAAREVNHFDERLTRVEKMLAIFTEDTEVENDE